ncbi:MAG: class I SAM-dependent methyltransferase [Terrabacter sp.]
MAVSAPSGDYWTTDPATRLRYATGVSVDPEDPADVDLIRSFLAGFPEWCQRAEAGADYLELGCGVAGGLLSQLQLFPSLRATAVELSADLVEEALARADRLGLTGRVELVVADAATFDRPASADLCFWSQFFFPDPSRRGALAAAHRAVRPGGLLAAPLVAAPARDDTRGAAVRARLASWGIPLRTPAALAGELRDAGFTDPQVVRSSLGTSLMVRRP